MAKRTSEQIQDYYYQIDTNIENAGNSWTKVLEKIGSASELVSEKLKNGVIKSAQANKDANTELENLNANIDNLSETVGKGITIGITEEAKKANEILNESTTVSENLNYEIYLLTSIIMKAVNQLLLLPRIFSEAAQELANMIMIVLNNIEIARLKIMNLFPGADKAKNNDTIKFLEEMNKEYIDQVKIIDQKALEDEKTIWSPLMTKEEFQKKNAATKSGKKTGTSTGTKETPSASTYSTYDNMTEAVSKSKEAIDDMERSLAELEKSNNDTFAGELLDAYKEKLTGVTGAFAKLTEAVASANDKQNGFEALAGRAMTARIGQLSAKDMLDNAKTPEEISKASEMLKGYSQDLDEATNKQKTQQTAIASGWLAVFQALADAAKSFWDEYDATLTELNETTLAEWQKSTMAWQNSMKNGIESLFNEIPIVGGLLSKMIDSLWNTDEDQRKAVLNGISQAQKEFAHEMNMGTNKSLQDQIDFYEVILAKQKEAGTSEDDIWATEEKIEALKKQQTEELKKQIDLAKDLNSQESKLYGRNAEQQVTYWQNKVTEIQDNLKNLGSEQSTNQNEGLIALATNNIAVASDEVERLKEKVASFPRWLTPQSVYDDYDRRIKDWEDEVTRNENWLSYYNAINAAAAAHNAEIKEQTELLKDAQEQLHILQGDVLRYQASEFEHELNLSNLTDDQKNKKRLAYYQDYLDQMQKMNDDYDQLEAQKEKELRAAQAAYENNQSANNKTAVDTIQAQLDAIEQERFTTEDIWAIEEKITDLKKAQTEEMKKQYDYLFKSGLLDKENMATIRKISSLADRQGYSFSDKYEMLSGYGISNASIGASSGKTITIGTVNNNNYQASADVVTSNMVGLISKKIGGLL